jgi:ATP-dependent Zn protease
MFLQTITEHQGHVLIRIVVILALMLGFLFLFWLFNRKRKNVKTDEPEILNFDEQRRRKSKKRRVKDSRRNK